MMDAVEYEHDSFASLLFGENIAALCVDLKLFPLRNYTY